MEPNNETLIVLYEDESEMIHSLPERPWCGQMDCPCHQDTDLLAQYLFDPMNDGLLTIEECSRLYWNEQVSA